MKKRWTKERRYDKNKREAMFENHLKKDGFTIEGYREYVTKTDLLISKDNITMEYSLPNENYNVKEFYNFFLEAFDLKTKLLKSQSNKKDASVAGKTFTISEQAYANKKAYIAEYNKAKYDRITLNVPAGDKEKYKALAEEKGMSLTELFITAVENFK